MATIAIQGPTKVARGVMWFLWEALTETNADGAPITAELGGPFHPDKTIHVLGDFGSGGTLVMQGSNDGTNWVTMTDIHGNAASYTAAALDTLAENPMYIRPAVTAGTSVDLDVYLVMRVVRPFK